MRWLIDAPAHYRLRAALESGKAAIRKVDGTWLLFTSPASQGIRFFSHEDACAAAVLVASLRLT